MIVRQAVAGDSAAVQAIYAHHVLNGFGTFEEVPPTVDEMTERIAAVLDLGLPYRLALDDDGEVKAYAYASPFRTRAAYRYTVETSVYTHPDAHRRGWGRAAMLAVLQACEALAVHQAVAVIGGSDNAGSVGLHGALGFEMRGILPGLGFKAGRWVDVVHMVKALNGGDRATPSGPGLVFDGRRPG